MVLGPESPITRFQQTVLTTTTVLLAAVDGPAVGIGATVLAHCDLVYATVRSYLQFPFTALGLVPEFGSSLVLPRLVGHARAAEMLLLGHRVSAAMAMDLGLINQVVSDRVSLDELVAERTAELLAKPDAAIRATKALLNTTARTPLEQLPVESALFAELLHSSETNARINALLTKRD